MICQYLKFTTKRELTNMAKIILILALYLTACAPQNLSTNSNKAYQKITGLKTPESVVQSKDGRNFISENGEYCSFFWSL